MGIEDTALGSARARFVEGLPRKAQELRGSVALLAATPDADKPREELRRRLHALYASAQVFRIDALSAALKEAIARLDGAREEDRPVTQDDIDALATLSATLPGLAGDVAASRPPSLAPPEVDPSAPPSPPRPAGERITAPFEKPRIEPRETRRISDRPPATEARKRNTLRGVTAAAEEMEPLRPARAGGSFTARRASTRPDSRHPTPLSTVLSVLVVDQVEWQTRIRELLPAERFELVAASDPEAALRLARTSSPDVVLIDHDILTREGDEFIARLHSDPLTDFVPVVLMLPAGTANDLVAVGLDGADESLGKPFDADTLVRTLARVTGAADEEANPISGSLTAEELAERLADELRRGIAEAAEHGRDVRVPIGDGSALLAAAWSAIARVREHLTRQSGGKVLFRDGPRRGGPALMALVDGDAAEDSRGDKVSLQDRRIVVVDDDPAVVWFFAGLLREEGAEVFEAENGLEALREARARRPDVIISDILMPELDGFGLCRALERDPSLADVPVILLSWKEDFLQRMRDLHSGARGYLRKEAGTAQILGKVREVLRPRARLEAQLSTGAEVRGRTEGLGVVTLLRCVAKHSPDARILIRDAWNLYEVDMRDGDLVDLTRTATDGSFARGPKALTQLLGVTSARFTVSKSDGDVMRTFREPLERVLTEGCEELGALVDAVSGKSLPLANELELEEDALASFIRTSPSPIQSIVERLRSRQSPRHLLMSGDVAPGNLESAMIDLARRGAILAVRGVDGEDRVALALEERRAGVDALKSPPILPPDEDEYEAGAATETETEPGEEATASASATDLDPSDVPTVPGTLEAATSTEPTEIDIRPPAEMADARNSDPTDLDMPFEQEEPGRDRPKSIPPPLPPSADKTIEEPVEAIDPSLLSPTRSKEAEELARIAESIETRRNSKAPRTEQEEPEPSLLGRIAMIVLFGLVGFIGMSALSRSCASDASQSASSSGDAAAQLDSAGPTTLEQEEMDVVVAPPRPEELAFGETLPTVEPGPGVHVSRNQGLLVIEAGEGAPPEVFIGARSLGRVPVREALDEGRYELRYQRGDEESYRFVYVRAGQTRVIPPL